MGIFSKKKRQDNRFPSNFDEFDFDPFDDEFDEEIEYSDYRPRQQQRPSSRSRRNSNNRRGRKQNNNRGRKQYPSNKRRKGQHSNQRNKSNKNRNNQKKKKPRYGNIDFWLYMPIGGLVIVYLSFYLGGWSLVLLLPYMIFGSRLNDNDI